ncbi:hypothetical protein chiPu_0028448, partial [Chiloscyllium punctatum]|nr:hypothetical protein [Chiloscyllium punctatum]
KEEVSLRSEDREGKSRLQGLKNSSAWRHVQVRFGYWAPDNLETVSGAVWRLGPVKSGDWAKCGQATWPGVAWTIGPMQFGDWSRNVLQSGPVCPGDWVCCGLVTWPECFKHWPWYSLEPGPRSALRLGTVRSGE